MKRCLLGVAFLAAAASSAAWAAASEPATPLAPPGPAQTGTPVIDESDFLRAAEEAAKAGDKEGAVQLFQSAIIYAPADPVPYERLAEFYVHSGQTELAQQYFTLALETQPAYAPALHGLAMLQLAAGNRAGAQAQHDILLHACGATCPETTQVEKALNIGNTP